MPNFSRPSAPAPQERLAVTARRVDTGAGVRPAEDNGIAGLVQGLSALNPALGAYANKNRQDEAIERARLEQLQREADATNRRDASLAGSAAAEREDLAGRNLEEVHAPSSGLTGAALALHDTSFKQGIAERHAADAISELTAKYQEQKHLPGFDLKKFTEEARNKNLLGLTDDAMTVVVGKRMDELATHLKSDYEGVLLKRLDEGRAANISAKLGNTITAGNPSGVMKTFWAEVQPFIEGQGKTKGEAAGFLLNHLSALSAANSGVPEFFDAMLSEKDSTGKTIADYNDHLRPSIVAARSQAVAMREKKIEEGSQEGNARTLKALDDRVAADPMSVTFEHVLGYLGPHNVFKTDNEVLAYWRNIQTIRDKGATLRDGLDMAKNARLHLMEKKEDQQAVMGQLTAPVVKQLAAAIDSGDTTPIAGLAQGLVNIHSSAGASVPSRAIVNMFEYVGKAAPGKSPTPTFKAAVEVYRAMEGSPALRQEYFNEDTRKVLENYIGAAGGGGDEASAYAQAYKAVSPETKRAEEALRKSPEFAEKMKDARKWVSGSSWWPRLLGGEGRPGNDMELTAAAQEHGVQWYGRNPSASPDQVLAETKAWMERSYVHDATTKTAVRVPEGLDGRLVQEALSAYTEKAYKDNRLGELDGDFGLGLVANLRSQGRYDVYRTSGGAITGAPVDSVDLRQLASKHAKGQQWSPEDAAALRKAATGGDVDEAVVSKARRLEQDTDILAKIDGAAATRIKQALASRIAMGGKVDTSALYSTDRKIRIDYGQTTQAAARLYTQSNGGAGADRDGIAASLVTLGEGVMLRAYPDPARGAGMNIGAGYNLNANKDNVDADLRRAGVPKERIEGIKNGTDSLSPEQCDRLTMVAVARYKALAEKQVGDVAPDLWRNLQPQQKAYLTDIAYQTGDVGKFKNAIRHLASGDMAAFMEASKVHYTNQQGQRVEDKRRNGLRNAMLAGTGVWQSLLSQSPTK